MRSVNVTVRARLVDQGERARPPWEGRRHDPMPPPSPGESDGIAKGGVNPHYIRCSPQSINTLQRSF